MKPKPKTVFIKKKLKKIEEQTLPSKSWISRYADWDAVGCRRTAVNWTLWAFGLAMAATFGIILLQGFHVAGFSLPEPILTGLETATVGEIGGLVVCVFKFLFK